MANDTPKRTNYDWEQLMNGVNEKKEGKTPRIENQRLMLTYKTHVDKAMLKQFLTELNKKPCDRIEVAHEIGKSGGIDYPHTHVAIDFGRRYINKKSDCMRAFDVKVTIDGSVQHIHPNIKIITSPKHWKNVLQYLGKEDSDNKHLLDELGDPSAGLREMLEDIRDGDSSICDNLIKYAETKADLIPIMQVQRELRKKSMTLAIPVYLPESISAQDLGTMLY